MVLKVELGQLKAYFDDLDFVATIDRNAPEAPWENTAVVVRKKNRNGIALIISVSRYFHQVVEVERVVEYGREAEARRRKQLAAYREHEPVYLAKVPKRIRDVIALDGTSTLEELAALVREHIAVREITSDAED